MQLIVWKVGKGNPVFMLLGAAVTVLIAHICCLIPIVLVPLGLSGAGSYIGKTIEDLQPILYALAVSMLLITGWKIHRNKKSHFSEKVVYWITVIMVMTIMLVSS